MLRNIAMGEILRRSEKYVAFLMRCLPILSFVVPFGMLYYLYPETFEMTWEGRTYYLFFLWLMLLETILNQKELGLDRWRLRSLRTIFFIVSLFLPTIYVVGANYFGWNAVFLELAEGSKIPFANFMPLSIEYLVFAVLFVVIAFAQYGVTGLRNYSITALFLGAIGVIYTINNVYPYGQFTPFQILVPSTTMLAAAILNMMGYNTSISYIENDPTQGSVTRLRIADLHGRSAAFNIAWPCSGVESLLIYSLTILLFLKNSAIPWKQKTVYFIFGAAITYVINALRIVTIFTIAINGGEVRTFHDFYGQLYSITWIMFYPLAIIASRALWGKFKNRRVPLNEDQDILPPTTVPR